MSSPRLTLKQFLGLESIDVTPDQLPDLEAGEAYAQVQAKLAGKAGPVWRIVRSQIPDQIKKLLDIDGVAILVGAWNKARELRKYRDATKYPPDDVVECADDQACLAEHDVVRAARGDQVARVREQVKLYVLARSCAIGRQRKCDETHMSEREISLGPCCFCAATIQATEVDPCQVTVETAKGQWQVWFCHAA